MRYGRHHESFSRELYGLVESAAARDAKELVMVMTSRVVPAGDMIPMVAVP